MRRIIKRTVTTVTTVTTTITWSEDVAPPLVEAEAETAEAEIADEGRAAQRAPESESDPA